MAWQSAMFGYGQVKHMAFTRISIYQ